MTSDEDLLAQAEARRTPIFGRRSGPALDQVAADYDRYAHVFEAFIRGGAAEQAARFVAALRDFWWARRQYAEGLAWVARVLPLPGLWPTSRAMVLDHVGGLAYFPSANASARRFLEASLELRRRGDSRSALALTLNQLAAVARWGADGGAGARALYEESLALAREAATACWSRLR